MEISQKTAWRNFAKYKFSGNFNCFESPVLLTTFMKWLRLGPCTNENLSLIEQQK